MFAQACEDHICAGTRLAERDLEVGKSHAAPYNPIRRSSLKQSHSKNETVSGCCRWPWTELTNALGPVLQLKHDTGEPNLIQ